MGGGKEAAKHPSIQDSSVTKSYLAPNITSTEAEKPWFRLDVSLLNFYPLTFGTVHVTIFQMTFKLP